MIVSACYCGQRISTGGGNRLNMNYCSQYCIELKKKYGEAATEMRQRKPVLIVHCEWCEAEIEIKYGDSGGSGGKHTRTFCSNVCQITSSKSCKRNDMNRMRILRILNNNEAMAASDISQILSQTSNQERFNMDKISQLCRTLKKWVKSEGQGQEAKRYSLRHDVWPRGFLKQIIDRRK